MRGQNRSFFTSFFSRKGSLKSCFDACVNDTLISFRHGVSFQRSQQRGSALRRLAEGRLHVLAATDMLARGVDIKGATFVVNASLPGDIGTYLHRAGRVGRLGGASGIVVSLPRTEEEAQQLRDYAHKLGFELEERRL